MLMLLRKWWKGDRTPAPLAKTVRPITTRPALETLEERAPAATLYAVTELNTLLRFDSASPGTLVGSPVQIQGFSSNSTGFDEFVAGIDFRPRTGQMFGLAVRIIDLGEGFDVVARLLTINPLTGANTQIGPSFAPDSAFLFGFDFDPLADRIQTFATAFDDGPFVSGFVLNPNDGSRTSTTTFQSLDDVVDSLAYDRNFDGRGTTTAYTINADQGMLQIVNLTTGQATNVGRLGVPIDEDSPINFDVRVSGQTAGAGFAYAVFDSNPTGTITNYGLYLIDLTSGRASFVGPLSDPTEFQLGLTAVPNSTIVTGTTGGITDSMVNVLDAFTNQPRISPINPFPGFTGALNVGSDDVNRDAIPDAVVAAQAPNGHVKAFDGATGAELLSAFAFPGFNGSVSVASGDVNGDGFHDIIAAVNGFNGHVKAISGADGSELASFFAFPDFMGPASVGAADFNNDGTDEVIVGAGGTGINGRFSVFDRSGTTINPGGFAFPGFNGPVSIAGGDIDGDGIPDIIVGPGAGTDGIPTKQDNDSNGLSDDIPRTPSAPGGPIKVLSGAGVFGGGALTEIASFFAYDQSYTGGVSVGVADVDQDGRFEVQTAPLGSGVNEVRSFTIMGGNPINTIPLTTNIGTSVAGARGSDGVAQILQISGTGTIFNPGGDFGLIDPIG